MARTSRLTSSTREPTRRASRSRSTGLPGARSIPRDIGAHSARHRSGPSGSRGPCSEARSTGYERDPVAAECLVHRLEERRAARTAVSRAAGREALSLNPRGAVGRHVRAARIARLGADIGAGETADDVPAAVVDGLVRGLDGPAVPPRGRAGATDGASDG